MWVHIYIFLIFKYKHKYSRHIVTVNFQEQSVFINSKFTIDHSRLWAKFSNVGFFRFEHIHLSSFLQVSLRVSLVYRPQYEACSWLKLTMLLKHNVWKKYDLKSTLSKKVGFSKDLIPFSTMTILPPSTGKKFFQYQTTFQCQNCDLF